MAPRQNLWVKFSKGTILKSFEIQDSHPLQWTVQVTISRAWKALRAPIDPQILTRSRFFKYMIGIVEPPVVKDLN